MVLDMDIQDLVRRIVETCLHQPGRGRDIEELF